VTVRPRLDPLTVRLRLVRELLDGGALRDACLVLDDVRLDDTRLE
jgi:hypothetical protein